MVQHQEDLELPHQEPERGADGDENPFVLLGAASRPPEAQNEPPTETPIIGHHTGRTSSGSRSGQRWTVAASTRGNV